VSRRARLVPAAIATELTLRNTKRIWPFLGIGLVLIATAIEEHLQGRLWWCSCRQFFWTGDAWSSRTSQLFLDPYSVTHVLHGLVFYGLVALLFRGLAPGWRYFMAMLIECVWEIIENTNTVIQRYREATASLGYQGDTVMNSMGDILCCGIGLFLARKLGWRRSIALFFSLEIVLLIWIRDSLLLEIIMLIHPIGAIKAWQVAH
jgi:uncharacterized membrane protein YjdF